MQEVIITADDNLQFKFPMSDEQLSKLCAYASKLADGNITEGKPE